MRKIALTVLLLMAFAICGEGKRHYTVGYNFIVASDSLAAQAEDPIVRVDSARGVTLCRGQELVVARLQLVPADSSVWAQIGTVTTGDSLSASLVWVREREMMQCVVPNNLISRSMHWIGLRSDLLFVVTLLPLVWLLMAKYLDRDKYVMLLDKVPTPYPWLLAASVSASVIAVRATDTSIWRAFYFAPTLNPLVPESRGIALSLALLWFTLIVLIATFTEVVRVVERKKVWSYICSIPCVCMLIVWLLTRM